MKLHLPKLLLTAVMAVVCCGASSYGDATNVSFTSATINGVTPTTGQTITILESNAQDNLPADLAGTSDYIVLSKNETLDKNGRYKVTSDVFADAESKVVIGAGSYTNDDGTTTSYYGGQLFVEATGNSSIKIDNDIIIGESKYKETDGSGTGWGQHGGALRLHEAAPNRKIVLAGNITLVSDAQFSIGGGSSKLNNYLEGYLNAEGKSLTLYSYGGSGGITFAGGANIGTLTGNAPVLFSATKSDGTAATSTSYTIGNLTTSAAVTVDSGVSLTIGNWTVEKTLVNNGTLSLTGTITLDSLANLEWSYTGYEDLSSNGEFDVYKTYKLVSGTGTLSGSTTTFSYNGGTYNVADGYSEEVGKKGYLVATGTVKVSEVTADVDMFHVNNGGILNIDGNLPESMSASQILATAQGAGNVVVTTNLNLVKNIQYGVTGKLTVTGATLTTERTYNGDGSANANTCKGYSFDLSRFSAVELNGATIDYLGTNTTLNNVTVGTEGATISIYDMNAATDAVNLAGITTLNGGLTVTSGAWKSSVNIGALTGAGALTVTGAGEYAKVLVDSMSNYSGAINVSGAKGRLTIDGDNSLTLNQINLSEGGTLAFDARHKAYTYTLNNVTVSGKGTIAVEASATFYESCVNIENLTNAEGSASGELTLSSNFRNGNANVFNLNGGDFAGVIAMNANTTGNRPFAFNITDATVAEDAEIKITNVSNDKGENPHTIALGIGNETVTVVTVKGISGGGNTAIYSGAQAFQTQSFASDGTSRTLEINTAGGNYTADVAVKDNINLVKSGAGRQTFSGDMSAFNGTVKVSGGLLEFSKADGNTTVSSLTLDGGALDVKGTLTLSNVTVDLSKYTAGTNIELVTAGTLSADALSVSYADGATTVGNYTGTLAQDGNSLWLTWKDTTTTVSSITTSVSKEGDWYTLSSDGTTTTLTLTVDGSLAGLAADGSVMVNLLTDKQLSAIMGDENLKNPYVLLELTDSDQNTVAADAFNKVVFVNEKGEGYYGEMVDFGDKVGTKLAYNVNLIPEPASATLSLAALMMLCARRRRRA